VIIADTSGLYATFNRRQPEHQAARAAVERDGGPLVLSPLVLAELDYFVLTRLGASAEQKVLAELRSPAYRPPPFGDDDFQLASEVAVKYSDMQLGLTNASIVVQAARVTRVAQPAIDASPAGAFELITDGPGSDDPRRFPGPGRSRPLGARDVGTRQASSARGASARGRRTFGAGLLG
jgi:uncharacterized protein